jgi:hypothetical protein
MNCPVCNKEGETFHVVSLDNQDQIICSDCYEETEEANQDAQGLWVRSWRKKSGE